MSRRRVVRIERISVHTAAVNGVPAAVLTELGVHRMWHLELRCWTVPAAAVETIATWATLAGHPVQQGLGPVVRR